MKKAFAKLALVFAVGAWGSQAGFAAIAAQNVGEVNPSQSAGSDISAKINSSMTANAVIRVPAGKYSAATTLDCSAKGVTIHAEGVSLTYTGTGKAVSIAANYCTISGLTLRHSGPAGSSIGIYVEPHGAGHHYSIKNAVVEGSSGDQFYDNIVIAQSYYGEIQNTDSYGAANANYHWTNGANSNSCVDCAARGGNTAIKLSRFGFLVDDTDSNTDTVRILGGTAEGNLLANIEIEGADNVTVVGPHLEASAPVARGTVTFTNGSTSITSAALFNNADVGRYIKANADNPAAWMRVCTFVNSRSETLCDPYQGASATGAASMAAADIHIADGEGKAIGNSIVNPVLAVSSGSAPAIYVEGGKNTQLSVGDISLPVILGSGATGTQISAGSFSGGLTDFEADSKVFGDASGSRYYLKMAGNKYFDLQSKGLRFPLGFTSLGRSNFGDSAVSAPAGGTQSWAFTAGAGSNHNILFSSTPGSILFTDNMALGNSDRRWKGLFSTTADFSGRITIGAGVNSDGSGFKHKRVASCTTAPAQFGGCTTNVSWTTAFADASYTVSCTMASVTAPMTVGWADAPTASGVAVHLVNEGNNAAASRGTLDCVAVHD